MHPGPFLRLPTDDKNPSQKPFKVPRKPPLPQKNEFFGQPKGSSLDEDHIRNGEEDYESRDSIMNRSTPSSQAPLFPLEGPNPLSHCRNFPDSFEPAIHCFGSHSPCRLKNTCYYNRSFFFFSSERYLALMVSSLTPQ
jgi:hypothetical protein